MKGKFMFNKIEKAVANLAEDDEVEIDMDNQGDKNQDKEIKTLNKSDLLAKISSLINDNKRLVTQNELITDALNEYKQKYKEKENTNYKYKILTLVESIQKKFMELINSIEKN